ILYHGLQSTSQENVLKIAYTDNAAINDTRITSDYFLSDASFLKIDAVSLGYTLNTAKWNKYLTRARFYVTARDLYTWTNYKGYNPEVNINGLYPGVEYVRNSANMYPQTTRWTFGVQLTF
ncbi:MAG: SusC/RagA family protein, partial [Duncaniella sp.]|nr:SusC/RagA family protein [Duncaniella sp.]